MIINPGDIGGAEREVSLHPCYNPYEVIAIFFWLKPYMVMMIWIRISDYGDVDVIMVIM